MHFGHLIPSPSEKQTNSSSLLLQHPLTPTSPLYVSKRTKQKIGYQFFVCHLDSFGQLVDQPKDHRKSYNNNTSLSLSKQPGAFSSKNFLMRI